MKATGGFIYGIVFFLGLSCNEDKATHAHHKTVNDYFNRSISIPNKVERVITLYYVQAEIVCAIGAKSKIVGIGKINATSSSFLKAYFSEILNLPQVGNQTNVSYEKIISLKPDIVFIGTEKPTFDRLRKLGYTAVATYPKTFNEICEEISLYGNVLGKEQQAQNLSSYFTNVIEKIKKRSYGLSQKAKPKVYYIRTDALTTLGGNILGEIIDLAGGHLVTNGIGNNETSLQLSLEDIYKYNPDVIIIRDRASVNPEDIYKDDKWRGIAAVRNRKIYKEHSGWTEFRLETIFGIIEKAKWLQPNLFKDFDADSAYLNFVDIVNRNSR